MGHRQSDGHSRNFLGDNRAGYRRERLCTRRRERIDQQQRHDLGRERDRNICRHRQWSCQQRQRHRFDYRTREPSPRSARPTALSFKSITAAPKARTFTNAGTRVTAHLLATGGSNFAVAAYNGGITINNSGIISGDVRIGHGDQSTTMRAVSGISAAPISSAQAPTRSTIPERINIAGVSSSDRRNACADEFRHH